MTRDAIVALDFGPAVTAVCTRRHPGQSRPPFDSYNMSLKVDYPDLSADEQRTHLDDALGNRRALSAAIGVAACDWVEARLVHGTAVHVAAESDRGKGALDHATGVPDCDGLITAEPGLPLAIVVADCAPVFLHDPIRKAIGIVHAGYAGAIDGVCRVGVEAMVDAFGCDPAHIVAKVGPCLGPAHLEMRNEAIVAKAEAAFAGRGSCMGPNGIAHLDVPTMVADQLTDAGVRPDNIWQSGLDTAGGIEFFSFRAADKEFFDPDDPSRYSQKTGRLAALIVLR